ncbi:MAG: alpha/beta fold hydrolase [Gemmatales bacterium]
MSRIISVLAALFLAFPLAAQEVTSGMLVGSWEGALDAGAMKLRIGFVLKENDKKELTGTMFSIDQGNVAITLDKTVIKGREVRLQMTRQGISYIGTLNDAGDTLTGHWLQGLGKLPLTLKKVPGLTKLNRPQEPKPPFPYRSEDVTYENTDAKVKLAGTLTLPAGNGHFPAVLLITGSGPQDRDEAILGHKPFLIIADYLTRRGIAVLRVDDRGIGKSTGSFATATTFDFASDVQAGVRYLASRPEIDKQRIGLIGHSEGGIIAPLVASKTSDIAFIVLLAGTGLPGDEIIYLQGRLIAKAGGAKEADLEASATIQRVLFGAIKAEKPGPELVKKLKELLKAEVAKLTPEQKKEMDKAGGIAQAEASLLTFTVPWFKTFITHDPVPVLKQVKCPVLALNGELDLQVPYKENLSAIEAALKAGGNKDYTIKSFPQLNHLFQTARTGAPSEYGTIEETFNPAVLQIMGDWITERVKR